MKSKILTVSAAALLLAVTQVVQGAITLSPGLTLQEEGGAIAPGNLAQGGSAFALDIIAQNVGVTPVGHNQPVSSFAAHFTTGVNAGTYGNTGSWIAGSGGSFVGINLGAAPVSVQSIAFGRDNLGQFGDRADGRSYTLQYTTAANPDNTTAAWTTIGTVTYSGGDPLAAGVGTQNFNFPARRHRIDFAPVMATGVRIVTPTNGTDIDEIELYSSAGGATAPMTLVQTGGSAAATGFNHAASANGGVAFAQETLVGFPATHYLAGVNEGTYGNTGSWIGANNGQQSFVGIDFTGADLVGISSIAFGRDNTGAFSDRNVGNYTLQYTTDADPTSASATWSVIDGVTYNPNSPATADRNRYAFNEVQATGIRLQVSSNATAIDELEAFGSLTISPVGSAKVSWNGNDGDNFNPAAIAPVPNNLALASNGAIAFSDGDLVAPHTTGNLNDGLYGNSNSWISDGDATSFAGIDLPGDVRYALDSFAFGRDNGNTAGDCCGGQLTDRSLGLYTVQYTELVTSDETTPFTGDPTTGWADLTTINYLAEVDSTVGGFFTPWLRHEFDIADQFDRPIIAGGLRILTPNGNAIDEIEVFGTQVPEPASVAMWVLLGIAATGFTWRRRSRFRNQR